MKNCGLVLWNAFAICEISKTSWKTVKTPYERGLGESFRGPTIPFGAMVEYYPISTRDQSRLHQVAKKVLLGIFLGYALIVGGLWKRDILIADIEELEKMDAWEIHPRRIIAKEVLILQKALSGELQGESEEPQPTESKDDAETRRDFSSIQGDFIYRHHNGPQVQLCVTKEETFPIPLEHVDVTRSTHTDLDVFQEKRIDDY